MRIIENLDYENLWTSFGKKPRDFTMMDISKLVFKSLDLCEKFYKMFANLKGFGVQNKGACKSRTNEQPTSRIFKCSTEGARLQKYLNNPNKKRKAKDLTRL